jgi:GNAT superfamily N-acetyltransferase
MKKIIIRNPYNHEYEDWSKIYQQYLGFYQTSLTNEELQKVWSWMFEPTREMLCYFAEIDKKIVGLVHFRKFIRPIKACVSVFLDDLFVLPEYRGHKIGYQLIEAVKLYSKENNLPLVRWVTGPNNKQAMNLYDSVANKTAWVIYDALVE